MTPGPPDAPDLPPPPRPINARVRARSWADPQVRFWWLSSLALLLLGAYLCCVQVVGWRRQVWLVEKGAPIVAVVKVANNEVIPRKQPANSLVILAFEWKGQAREVVGTLEGRDPRDQVSVKDKVALRIDPADPDVWTARKDRPPLAVELVGGGILIGLSVLVLGPAFVARARVLRTWRDGPASEAVVVGRQQTPLAPRAGAVRCTLAEDDADAADPVSAPRRVYTVYAPALAREGDSLTVIFPPRGGRPLVAGWFA